MICLKTLLCFWTVDGVSVGLPQWLSGKEFVCNAESAGNVGSIPGSERSPEEGVATHSSTLA